MIAKSLDSCELRSIKDFVNAVAREAGEIQRRHLSGCIQIEFKGAIDLVTEVDHLCEQLIVGRILDRFPRHHIVAEEGQQYSETDSSFRWYIDPLDGTVNYVHGYPCFCVSIGLEAEGEMVLGVVYDPVREEIFQATKGNGAFFNGEKISVSGTRDLGHSLLATGFPYDIRESQETNIDHFASFALASQGVRRGGSAALDLCYVAVGRLDGFWELKLSPWDLAAGIVMVREAGGRVSDFGEGPFRIDSGEVLATNGLIHRQMASVLAGTKSKKGA
jgi:myo-inositol-1(or 4)-monophosphatase